jgi:hypothetical protein
MCEIDSVKLDYTSEVGIFKVEVHFFKGKRMQNICYNFIELIRVFCIANRVLLIISH